VDRRGGTDRGPTDRHARRAPVEQSERRPKARRYDCRRPISYDDVYRVRPFGNEVVKLRITGATLRQLIERTENRYYYSNLSIGWNAEAAAGNRIVDLRFADGREVGDESSYTLATSDYLADAGDMLAPLPRELLGVTVLDAMINYLKTLDQPVRLPEEQRFRIVTER